MSAVMTRPRCGRAMEGRALGKRCGRPLNHTCPCLNEEAYAKRLEADARKRREQRAQRASS